MFRFFPAELTEGLHKAQASLARKKSRLRLSADGQEYPIVKLWHDGLSLDATQIDHLRGNVDVYDGGRHLLQCLIIASEVEAGQLVCTFKRFTTVSDRPALDYARDENAPAGYLPRA